MWYNFLRTFLDLSPFTLVLLSMMSFNLQRCTGNKSQLSVNCNSVCSSSFDGEFSSSLVHLTSDGFLLMAMASILLSSSIISQLTNVHN